jgi:hypothetical protein
MIRIALPVVFTFLLSATMSRAQSNCPEEFRYVGTLSGNGSGDAPLDARKTLNLPPNATLDVSFQQKSVRATNGRRGAHSSMRAQDVPKGILIIPSGVSDNVSHQGWAVSDPELKALDKDASGRVTQYQFGMRLFCNASSSDQIPTIMASARYKWRYATVHCASALASTSIARLFSLRDCESQAF